MYSVLAFACWLIDRLLCHSISQIWQLHAWWHILMAMALHQSFVCTETIHLYQQYDEKYVQLTSQAGLAWVTVQKVHDKKH